MQKQIAICLMFVLCAGCVSTGKYRIKTEEAARLEAQSQDLNDKLAKVSADLKNAGTEKDLLQVEKDGLTKRLADMGEDNKKLSEALNADKNTKDRIISDLTQTKQSLEAEIRDKDQQIAQLTASRDALQKEKDAAIASMKTTYDTLVANLQTEIKQGEVQITQLEGKLTVNMVDKILFDSGQAEVNKQGRSTLDSIATVLKKTADRQIRIEGHTDNVPISKDLQATYPSNWELSAARATHVARYLIDEAGIKPQLISIAGYADTRPVALNDTPEGRARNRRIEIVLVPMDTNK